MTPHIAQRSVQEFMTFYLHILITDSPRYFDGGEAVKQIIPSDPVSLHRTNSFQSDIIYKK